MDGHTDHRAQALLDVARLEQDLRWDWGRGGTVATSLEALTERGLRERLVEALAAAEPLRALAERVEEAETEATDGLDDVLSDIGDEESSNVREQAEKVKAAERGDVARELGELLTTVISHYRGCVFGLRERIKELEAGTANLREDLRVAGEKLSAFEADKDDALRALDASLEPIFAAADDRVTGIKDRVNTTRALDGGVANALVHVIEYLAAGGAVPSAATTEPRQEGKRPRGRPRLRPAVGSTTQPLRFPAPSAEEPQPVPSFCSTCPTGLAGNDGLCDHGLRVPECWDGDRLRPPRTWKASGPRVPVAPSSSPTAATAPTEGQKKRRGRPPGSGRRKQVPATPGKETGQ